MVTIKEGVKSKQFWQLVFLSFNGNFFGLYMASVYKQMNLDILDDHILTTAGAIGSICNGGSRVIWGSLQDKFGFKKVFLLVMCVQLVLSFSIY